MALRDLMSYRQSVTTPRDLKEWERAYANRIVDSANAARERNGWTIARLASELRTLGWSVSTETLNGILSSRKRGSFSVGEVYCLSRALSLPPLYLLNGLPSAAPLPPGPAMPDPDVVAVHEWLSDSEPRAAEASPLALLSAYARALSDAKWHNALWIASGGDLGVEYLPEDVSKIARKREQWRDHASNGYDVPELPKLPDALDGLDDAPSFSPHRPPPWSDFSGDAWMERAKNYVARLAASKAEQDELRKAERGAPSYSAD